jgi:hypothetical protein
MTQASHFWATTWPAPSSPRLDDHGGTLLTETPPQGASQQPHLTHPHA